MPNDRTLPALIGTSAKCQLRTIRRVCLRRGLHRTCLVITAGNDRKHCMAEIRYLHPAIGLMHVNGLDQFQSCASLLPIPFGAHSLKWPSEVRKQPHGEQINAQE
jgi:hypothetical protein